MFKTYVSTIQGSIRKCLLKKKNKKNISTNAQNMSGKIQTVSFKIVFNRFKAPWSIELKNRLSNVTTFMILYAILRTVYYVYLDHIFLEVLYARSKAIFHMMHYLNWMNYDFTYTHKVFIPFK